MGNGRYNINLSALSIVCYLLVLIGHVEALLLVAGFIIIAEQNEKAVIQAVQAVTLLISYNIIVVAVSKVTLGMAGMLENVGIYEASLRMQGLAIGTGYLMGTMVNIGAIICIVFIVMKKPIEVPFVRLVLNKESLKEKSTMNV